MREPVTIGVLALQGDFAAHMHVLESLGCRVREVRRSEEAKAVDGLLLPGGETTTLIKLLHEAGLWDVVRCAPGRGQPVFGTCAGLVLLSERVTDPSQESMGLLPVSVRRNAYGRQVDSFAVPGSVRVPDDLASDVIAMLPHGESRTAPPILATEFVFIRAPLITETRESLDVLARYDGAPVLVRSGWVLGGSFHPELAADSVVESLFIALVKKACAQRSGGNGGDPADTPRIGEVSVTKMRARGMRVIP